MMRRLRPSVSCCLITLAAGLLPSGVRGLHAQEAESTAPGPARAQLHASAATFALDPPPSPVWILGRFHAFQSDFSSDFGVGPLDRGDAVENLSGEIAARWGDTRWYDWVRRGIALYARVESWTETRHRGFDMEVEMDDLPEGKLGVRVNRALE